MKLIGPNFNIEEIRYGHDSEGAAFNYLIKKKNIPGAVLDKNPEETWKLIEAHEDGFECGIKWLASYLAEYGITIELRDRKLPVIEKEHWYSGEIINK